MMHTGNVQEKLEEAKDTLFRAETYMDSLGKEFDELRKKKLTDKQVLDGELYEQPKSKNKKKK